MTDDGETMKGVGVGEGWISRLAYRESLAWMLYAACAVYSLMGCRRNARRRKCRNAGSPVKDVGGKGLLYRER